MAVFNGGPGNDSLTGGFFADTLNGFGGNDTLRGGDVFPAEIKDVEEM